QPGAGTTVRIFLPSVETSAEVSAPKGARGPVARGNETILLVEDEEAVRTFAATVLAAQGYRVIAASNGSEAVALSAAFEGAIDLLITDVIMPGLSGIDVADRVQGERPRMKVLYISGYTHDANSPQRLRNESVEFLAKPFSA